MILTALFQAALLHNVEFRYHWDLIYTYVGHLLLAVNPYKSLGVYVEEMVQAYVFLCLLPLTCTCFTLHHRAHTFAPQIRRQSSTRSRRLAPRASSFYPRRQRLPQVLIYLSLALADFVINTVPAFCGTTGTKASSSAARVAVGKRRAPSASHILLSFGASLTCCSDTS